MQAILLSRLVLVPISSWVNTQTQTQDTLKSLDKLGEGFDAKVLQWKDKLMPRIQQTRPVGHCEYHLVDFSNDN